MVVERRRLFHHVAGGGLVHGGFEPCRVLDDFLLLVALPALRDSVRDAPRDTPAGASPTGISPGRLGRSHPGGRGSLKRLPRASDLMRRLFQASHLARSSSRPSAPCFSATSLLDLGLPRSRYRVTWSSPRLRSCLSVCSAAHFAPYSLAASAARPSTKPLAWSSSSTGLVKWLVMNANIPILTSRKTFSGVIIQGHQARGLHGHQSTLGVGIRTCIRLQRASRSPPYAACGRPMPTTERTGRLGVPAPGWGVAITTRSRSARLTLTAMARCMDHGAEWTKTPQRGRDSPREYRIEATEGGPAQATGDASRRTGQSARQTR